MDNCIFLEPYFAFSKDIHGPFSIITGKEELRFVLVEHPSGDFTLAIQNTDVHRRLAREAKLEEHTISIRAGFLEFELQNKEVKKVHVLLKPSLTYKPADREKVAEVLRQHYGESVQVAIEREPGEKQPGKKNWFRRLFDW